MAQILSRNPIKQIDQDDLIEQIMLKPEHDFPVISKLQKVIVLFVKKLQPFTICHAVPIGGVLRPDLSPFLRRQPAWCWALAQRVGPSDHLARQVGFFKLPQDIITAADVKHTSWERAR